MWTVVCYENDNSVEAVPYHWVKHKLCAWPNKDAKKKIEYRTIYNKFDFSYFPSRVLKKGIGKF